MRRVAVQQGYRVYATPSAYWCTGVLGEGYRPRAECISTRATVGRSGVPGSTRLFLVRGTDIYILPTALGLLFHSVAAGTAGRPEVGRLCITSGFQPEVPEHQLVSPGGTLSGNCLLPPISPIRPIDPIASIRR